MKKLIALILFISLSFNLYSQKVNVEIDEFTGDKNISTSFEKVVWDNKKAIAIYFSFLYKNEKVILECGVIPGPSSSIIVSSDSPLAIKFNNDNIVTLKSINYAIATEGGAGVIGTMASYANPGVHVRYSFSSQDDVKLFLDNLITFIRFSYSSSQGDVYKDVEVKEKDAKKLQKTYKMFIDEINKTTE